jgi:hypothetical protein
MYRAIRDLSGLLILLVLLVPSALQSQGNGGVVSGEIRLPDGSPAAGVRVSAMSVSDGITDTGVFLEKIAETDSSGRYVLRGISAGPYYIIAGVLNAPTYYPGTDAIKDARVLRITDGSTLDAVNFTVRRPPVPIPASTVRAGIGGKVVVEGAAALPRFLPKLYVDTGKGTKRNARGEDGARIRGSGTFGALAVGRDGSFLLLLDDGDYDISLITSIGESLTAGDGYYVKSIVSGTTDLLKQKLAVRRGTAAPITITLAAGSRP